MSDPRWHTPMTTDIDKLEDYGDSSAAFGELDGDYPPEPERDDVKCSTLEEVLEYYDQHLPYNPIEIL